MIDNDESDDCNEMRTWDISYLVRTILTYHFSAKPDFDWLSACLRNCNVLTGIFLLFPWTSHRQIDFPYSAMQVVKEDLGHLKTLIHLLQEGQLSTATVTQGRPRMQDLNQ